MDKPIIEVDLQGPDGNVFALMAKARVAIISAVRRPGFRAKAPAEELARNQQNAEVVAQLMMQEVMQAHSYTEALDVIRRYVTIREEVHG